MPISRAELEGDITAEHRATRQEVLDRCMANDVWAKKIFKNMAVLIISYPGQRAYLKASVESHAKLGCFMALSYDNYVDPAAPAVDHNDFMPDKETLDKLDLMLLPHHQTWGDTDYPFFWALKWGAGALQNFEYIYCVNGDFVLEAPENFEQLLALMGDADVMTCGPDYENFLANGAFVIKSKAFLPMVQYMQDTFIPFEKYEQNIHKFHNAEERMAHAIPSLGLKKLTVPKPMIWDRKGTPPGTWYTMVGARHIHGELDYALKKRIIPPHHKFLDEKYLPEIYNYKLIKEYWDSGNIEILENWWLQ